VVEQASAEALRQQILENQKIIDDLNKSLSRKTQEVRIIQEIASEMNATLELDQILHIILESMDNIFGYKHAMILLLDEDGNTLKVAASRGYPASGVGAEVKVGQGVIGIVAKRKKIMRMGNVGTQVAYFSAVRSKVEEAGMAVSDRPNLPGLPNVQSQVAIPLVLRDQLVGVFAVESPEQSLFDERDEALITILAAQAASAIHNARLYGAVTRLNETLEEKVLSRTKELERANAKLVQTEKMVSLGLLVAGIAHEMNTPLGSTLSMHDTLFRALEKLDGAVSTELPEGAPLRGKVERLLGVITNASKVIREGDERIAAIVRRLKSFARLDEADLKRVDIHEGLEDTLALLGHELTGVEVVRDYGQLPQIACFPARLNQVFLNVIRNARQAIAERGVIRIRTRDEGSAISVEVEDDGAGISPADLPRVFDPGFTTRGVGVGTGLGLAISYQIMHDHGGDIRIESELGKGTKVRLVLRREV
jgi:signal transduction histidine kinase